MEEHQTVSSEKRETRWQRMLVRCWPSNNWSASVKLESCNKLAWNGLKTAFRFLSECTLLWSHFFRVKLCMDFFQPFFLCVLSNLEVWDTFYQMAWIPNFGTGSEQLRIFWWIFFIGDDRPERGTASGSIGEPDPMTDQSRSLNFEFGSFSGF